MRYAIPFIFVLTCAAVAAEQEPAVAQTEKLSLQKWRQPAYDDLLKSYKVDEKKTNHYRTKQRYRVYDVPDDEKVFKNGTWHHPNYNGIRKKDVAQSKRKKKRHWS